MKNLTHKKILIFAPGTIGDTLLAIPSLCHLCTQLHAQHNRVHLYNSYPETASAVHAQLFQNLNLFDRMRFVPVSPQLWMNPLRRIDNLIKLRQGHYDVIIDIPCDRPDPMWMLRCFGAGKIFRENSNVEKKYPRWKYLFDLFASWGIPYVSTDFTPDWKFTEEEQLHADQWFEALNIPGDRTPFAMCTGGKCALQHWPLDRYAEVLKKIVPEYHLFPIFFGSADELRDAELLIRECGCGLFADNTLTLREKILALRKCKFYLGNNTGIMHLAGAAGIGGIGIASARDPEHYWEPMCTELRLITADVPCKGCGKMACTFNKSRSCIQQISMQEIYWHLTKLIKN